MGLATVKQKITGVFANKGFKIFMAIFTVGILGFVGLKVFKPVATEVANSKIAKDIHEGGVSGAYTQSAKQIWHKLRQLEDLDRDNEKLISKIADLEKELADTKNKLDSEKTQKLNKELAKDRKVETGSELGAVLAQIKYEVPTNLMPHQLYALAVGYIRKDENEQAAVILSNLVSLKEDKSYQRPEVYLLTGVSWYRLKHFKQAQEFFEKAESSSKSTTSIYRQTMVWKALAQQQIGERTRSQLTLLKLMDEYPHAEEVKWFNGGLPPEKSEDESKRAPAAEEHKTADEHKPADDHKSADEHKPAEAKHENHQEHH